MSQPLSATAEAALSRALRDIADGHLAVFRDATGRDYADRGVIGAPEAWWEILAARGQYAPPESRGRWRLLHS